ncbi:MAG TPA: succinylglutamate desuccinylase/aspartoacylase family protein [Chthoniobacteraceae bacterium]
MHRSHDYRHLVERWRKVASTAGLRLRPLVRADGLTVYYLQTRALQQSGGIYISAGIHGDEPGATEGLLTWAEANVQRLAHLPLLLLPCLNPWGLRNNSRFDEAGEDLNRAFQRDEFPIIAAMKKLLGERQFEVALNLHEDYDGEGAYLYEIQRDRPFWGEALLEVARAIIPVEPRDKVDGRKTIAGLIRRRFDLRRFNTIGFPEAIYLHLHHSRRSLTFETPSEFALEQRAAAHAAILDECVRRICG